MAQWLDAGPGDPSRLHEEGRATRDLIEGAREQVAAHLSVTPRQVIFTSGATESIHHATSAAIGHKSGAIALAEVEHSAVRESSKRASEVLVVGVDSLGRIDFDFAKRTMDRPIALVQCQFANHEVGTTQDVLAASEFARSVGAWLHVDAACSGGHVELGLDEFDWDLISLSSHKLGGPPGIGALIVRRGLRLAPMFIGSQQERARRAGFENMIGMVGFGAVLASLDADTLRSERARASTQIESLANAATAVEGVSRVGDPNGRLPHIICLGVDGVEAEAVLLGLDRAGISAHSGSACSAESLEPSPVLAAMGTDPSHSLRLSVGWSTTDADIEAFAQRFPRIVADLRSLAD